MELTVNNLPASEERYNEYDLVCSVVITLCQQGWSDNKQNLQPVLESSR